jgi:signal transduction histidine kinase
VKSLRARLTVWFATGIVVVLAVFLMFSYRVLDAELHHKSWQRDYPEHPDWKLHGSYSEEEIRDVMGELVRTSVGYGVPLALLALVIGYWLARKSVTPIAAVNQQLQSIRAPDLSQRIQLPEVDREFRDLVRHINELLVRLEKSFNDMSEYAAKVAHELRTPLAILRLKVEQAGGQIVPELAEDLQAELHQLSHVVDQSLLIAKAEQGRLILAPQTFDLATLVTEVAEDFSLLAQEQNRVLHLVVKSPSLVVADPKYAKQIIHNLLANALKHGQGEVRVTLRWRSNAFLLTLTNRLRSQPAAAPATLGLGLRVVDSLLWLQKDLGCRRRANSTCYAVRLSFPAAAPDARVVAVRDPLPPALDPGI